MRRRDFTALVLALGGAPLGAHSRAQTPLPITADDYFARLDVFGFSGCGFLIEQGRTLWSGTCGWADKARRARFDANTRFDVASLSKPMTALVILRLAEEGRLSLNDPLNRFLPGAPEDKAGVTLAQLLSHSAGFVRQARAPGPDDDKATVLNRIMAEDLAYAPGERFRYSNDGYRLLAAVIEAVEQRSYRDSVRDRIFRPAGMRDSGFVQDPPLGGVVAQGYNGWKALGGFALPSAGWDEGAGNIVSTLGDMQRFALAVEDGRVVRRPSLALATEAHSPDVGDSDYSGYGYGWYVGAPGEQGPWSMHGGDKTGYHCELYWRQGRGSWVFVLTTHELYDTSGFGLGLHMRRALGVLERIRDGQPFNPPPAARPIDDVDAQRLIGDYVDGAGGVVKLVRRDPADPHLTAIAIGQTAADAVTGVTLERAGQLAAANGRALGFSEIIVRRDVEALKAALGDQVFFAQVWVDAFSGWSERAGAWRGFGPVTSRSTPLGGDQIRTWLPFDFEHERVVMEFTWNDGRLYETLADTDAPSSVVLPVAIGEDGGLVVWDMATNRQTMATSEDSRLKFERAEFVRV